MLARVLEPEVMDTPDDARDYDAMDHTAVNRLFADDFLQVWNGGNPVLDVGTGTALIPIELCRQSLRAGVVAVDLADAMLAVAKANIEKAGLTARIMVQKANARQLPFPVGTFAAVVSNSIAHHLPEPAAALAEMHRVCRAGGRLFVRDLLRPDDDDTLSHQVRQYAGGANEHQRQLFADSLRAALTLAEVQHLVADLGYDPHTVEQTSDRHWTWSADKHA